MNKKIKIALGYIFLFVLFSMATIIVNVYDVHRNILGHIDIPNHFLGGIIVAIPLFIFLPIISNREIKIIITAAYLSLIGFGWEIFETMALENGYSPGSLFVETPLNKVSDLAFGLVGFLVSSRLVLKTKMRNIYRAGKQNLF